MVNNLVSNILSLTQPKSPFIWAQGRCVGGSAHEWSIFICLIYPFPGGMQDYNYIYGNCVEITLELSCCKYPYTSQLPDFWHQNRKSLLVYIAQVHRGVRGLIMDMNGNLVPRASLKIKGRDVTFRSSKRGEYWRLLLPGTYTLGELMCVFIIFSQRIRAVSIET